MQLVSQWITSTRMGFPGGAHAGVSQPPGLWHSGPGIQLKPGDQVWFVMSTEWPCWEVRSGHFSSMVSSRLPERVARLKIGRKEGLDVIFPRIFVSRQLAEAEASVLEAFAHEHPKPSWSRQIEPCHRRTFTDTK